MKHYLTYGAKILVYFLLVYGIFGLNSCTNDSFESADYSLKESMTDQEILEWQKTLWPKTRSTDAPIGVVVTTASNITCSLNTSEVITVNWGDGNINTIPANPQNEISHSYTDGLPGHTITFTGSNNSIVYFTSRGTEIIHADFSRSIGLLSLDLVQNRLTTIYVNDNYNLQSIDLTSNNLSALNVDNLTNLRYINIGTNPISSINVRNAGSNLTVLYLYQTQIVNLDISKNSNLHALYMHFTKITPIDLSSLTQLRFLTLSDLYSNINLSYFPSLEEFSCDLTGVKSLDFSNNPLIQNISCVRSNVEDVILPDPCNQLKNVNLYSTPVEQNRRKIMNLAYELPDRNNMSQGKLITISPYIENFRADVEDYNWIIITPQ